MPMPRAASRSVGSFAFRPAMVLDSTGRTAYAMMPIRAARRPMPSQMTSSASRPIAGVA